MFWPLTTAGFEIALVQTAGGTKSVADSNMNPVALVGQVNTRFVSARSRAPFN
jgi:hypothetical protein